MLIGANGTSHLLLATQSNKDLFWSRRCLNFWRCDSRRSNNGWAPRDADALGVYSISDGALLALAQEFAFEVVTSCSVVGLEHLIQNGWQGTLVLRSIEAA